MLNVTDKVREELFSEATLMLGEIHWALLKSESVMDGKRWEMKEGPFGSMRETTTFGKQVGMDEIHWWVFEKEDNVDDLFVKTETILDAVQVLKDASSKLKAKESGSYRELLLSLKDFAERYREEICSLYGYVYWLMERDVMAPRILFTYRVWGSSRMSDRFISVEGEENARSDINKLRELTEIALGVRIRQEFVYNKVHFEIGFEIFESSDPEELTGIHVPESLVVRRTADDVFQNCTTYFTELRDSLRNILVDLQKLKEQRELFQNDQFWRDFIESARNARTVETQLWDLKETLTIWHVKGDRERREAKVKFAEDVASFANSTGGVLIVGVNDQREIVGIGTGLDLENRLKVAADVIAEHIEYERELVSLRQIALRTQDGEKICLIVVVSQASRAVAVGDGLGKYTYPVRRETGITRVSREEVPVSNLGLKSDNRDFMRQLKQFIRDH